MVKPEKFGHLHLVYHLTVHFKKVENLLQVGWRLFIKKKKTDSNLSHLSQEISKY